MEFHPPPRVNESDMLSIKKTHDAAIHLVEKNSTDDPKQMKVFFEAALLCYERQSIAAYAFSVNSEVFLFPPDGKMLHCSAKSALHILMKRLEKFSAWWRIRVKNDHWSSYSCKWNSKYRALISSAICCQLTPNIGWTSIYWQARRYQRLFAITWALYCPNQP